MKPTQLPLIRNIVNQMVSEARSIRTATNADSVPVIQRVASSLDGTKYVQIVTTVGMLTIRDDGKLTKPDYPIVDIGVPDNWSKVSKEEGVIVAKSPVDVPFQRAANVSVFADEELATVTTLLDTSVALPPVTVMFHPGSSLVFTEAEGKSLIWAYDPLSIDPAKAGGFKNLKSEWTKNPLECVNPCYGVIRGWHRAVAGVFPKDRETGQPTKLDGVAVSQLGNRTGIRIVSRELGMVASLALSHLPSAWREVTYLDLRGALIHCDCDESGVYTKNSDKSTVTMEETMNVKMIDIGQIKQQATKEVAPKPEEKPTAPAVDATDTQPPAVEPQQVQASTPEEIPVTQPHTEAPVTVTTKTVDELFAELFRLQTERDELTKQIKTTQKAIQKAYKAEIKELKSNTKDNEELTRIRAAHKRLRALLDAEL